MEDRHSSSLPHFYSLFFTSSFSSSTYLFSPSYPVFIFFIYLFSMHSITSILYFLFTSPHSSLPSSFPSGWVQISDIHTVWNITWLCVLTFSSKCRLPSVSLNTWITCLWRFSYFYFCLSLDWRWVFFFFFRWIRLLLYIELDLVACLVKLSWNFDRCIMSFFSSIFFFAKR